MSRSLLSSIIGAAVLLGGCGFHTEPLVAGGVGGAAAGAGTGALVGALISNGDVAASALLGGAIGLPVGIAVGALYDYNSEESVRERKMAEIQANHREIFARQREIDALREQIRNDGPTGNPSQELRGQQYDGPTIGDVYR